MKPIISLFWSQIDSDKPDTAYIQIRFESGRVVAQLRLEVHDAAGWVGSLFVNPEYRNRGLASLLLYAAFNVCKRKGFQTVGLTVKKDNILAKRLYKRLGFVSLLDGYKDYNQLIKVL